MFLNVLLLVLDITQSKHLKKLEDDIDAQVLTPNIIDIMETRSNCEGLDDLIEYFANLYYVIHETLHFEKCITTQIYNYLKLKELK